MKYTRHDEESARKALFNLNILLSKCLQMNKKKSYCDFRNKYMLVAF